MSDHRRIAVIVTVALLVSLVTVALVASRVLPNFTLDEVAAQSIGGTPRRRWPGFDNTTVSVVRPPNSAYFSGHSGVVAGFDVLRESLDFTALHFEIDDHRPTSPELTGSYRGRTARTRAEQRT